MKAKLTCKLTGEVYECFRNRNHPDSPHGLAVWVDSNGTALQQVEVPNFLSDSLRYEVDITEMSVIDKIREIMKEKDLTPYQIAKDSGITRQTIENALSEGVSPTLATLTAICEALGYELYIKPKEKGDE